MHVNWKHLAIALAILPFAAVLAAWIGFFNVGASTGHWKITEWFLHFAMRSAVRTYALSVDVPEELPRHAIQPAAGHFARGCAICHGAPGEPRSPAAMRMLPRPPDLSTVVGDWTDAELFRIVKHGVRFTGMPAWPTQARDDEVWAMVAFLRELPAMDAATYRHLAYGEALPVLPAPADLEQALADCARCHGGDGMGRSAATPVLAGQSEAYLLDSLRAYLANARPGGVMSLPATAAGEQLLPMLARHYAGLRRPAAPPAEPVDAALLSAGESIAQSGLPARDVPACLGCHDGRRNPAYPLLFGQPADYIRAQLALFRDGKRGGSRFAHLMHNVAQGLSDDDIRAVAAYFAAADRPAAD